MGPMPVPAVRRRFAWTATWLGGLMLAAALAPADVWALPIFARQTGQNCLACHAGGQFPELTPYGRMFKMTGYTIGERTVPLAGMGVIGYAKVANTGKDPNPQQTFAKDGSPKFEVGSLFIGGKITDNIGAFSQITYDNYNNQAGDAAGPPGGGGTGYWQGHTQADNIDIRYADRFVDTGRDLIFGVSLNNNPSVSDPWNTAAAWMQYVPASGGPGANQFIDMNTPYPGNSAGSNVAGVTAYLYWNKTLYGEVGLYRTADQAFSFMSAGIDDAGTTHLRGTNPYWRLAYTREWGAHNLMVGTSGMIAHVYDGSTDVSDPNAYNRVKSVGVDAQYQYLLDPHTVTAQLVYQQQRTDYSANTMAFVSPYFLADGVTPAAAPNSSDTLNIFRAKFSYVYQAKYGGSISYFNQSSTTNTLNQTSGYDSNGQITYDDPLGTGITSTPTTGNLSGNLGASGMTFEAFWLPTQYVRVGAQYTAYGKYNGASSNYDGLGRNARDNNSLFLYIWGAY